MCCGSLGLAVHSADVVTVDLVFDSGVFRPKTSGRL